MWGFKDLRSLVEGCGWGWTWTLKGKKLSILKYGARSGLCAQMLRAGGWRGSSQAVEVMAFRCC